MIDLNKVVEGYSVIMVDLDNTLFNYSYAHNAALDKTLSNYNISLEEYKESNLNIKKRDLNANHHKKELYFKDLCERLKLPLSATLDMYELYEEVFHKNLKADLTIFNMILNAKRENKCVLAITNYYIIPQLKKLNISGFLTYIDYMITSEEFEIEKPNKRLFDRAMELTSTTNLKEVIMFGDSIVDDMTSFGIKYFPYNCSKLLISVNGDSDISKVSGKIESFTEGTIVSQDENSPVWMNKVNFTPSSNIFNIGMYIKNIYHDIQKINSKHNNNNRLLDVVIISDFEQMCNEISGDYIKIKIFISTGSLLTKTQMTQKNNANIFINTTTSMYNICVKDLRIGIEYIEGELRNIDDGIEKLLTLIEESRYG